MFIRQTRTNNKITGEGYFTFRLVRGERIGGKVRQITVLNLGRHFPIKQEDWPLLCCRIEHLLHSQVQESLLDSEGPVHIERAAQRYVRQLIARAPLPEQDANGIVATPDSDATLPSGCEAPNSAAPVSAATVNTTPASTAPDYHEVDINSLQQATRVLLVSSRSDCMFCRNWVWSRN